MVVAFTGIQKAGLVWVPINTGLAASAIDNIIEHAEIQYLVVDGDLYASPSIMEIVGKRKLRCIVLNPVADLTGSRPDDPLHRRDRDHAGYVARRRYRQR